MLVVLASVQSCGVTTASLALTAVWPGARPPAVVVELDPAGGELVSRFSLAVEPSTLTLAADLQRAASHVDAAVVRSHAQELPGGSLAVPAPIDGAEAHAALDVLARSLPAISGVDLLADCGRMDGRSPDGIVRLAAAADVVVLVAPPTLPHLLRLQVRLAELRSSCSPVLLLCGDGPFHADQVAETLDVPVVGHLPRDVAGAAMFRGEPSVWRRPHRLPLLRAASPIAAALCEPQPLPGADAAPVLADVSA